MKKKNITIIILLIFLLGLIFNNKLMSFAYPVYKNIAKTKIENNVKNYKTAYSKHFIIKYTDNDSKYIDLIIETAEKHYYDVVNDLGCMPTDKTIIIVYPTPYKMSRDFSLAKGDDAMGIYLDGIISIQSPALWIKPGQNLKEVFEKEGPVVHEFTHLIVDDIAKGNYPVWFTEGLALLEEYRQNKYEWGKGYNYYDKPYTLKQLTDDFDTLDEMLAYKRAFQVTKAISDKYGMSTIRSILKDLGNGMNLKESFYKETGEELNSFVLSVKG
jgi:hypothetical protein